MNLETLRAIIWLQQANFIISDHYELKNVVGSKEYEKSIKQLGINPPFKFLITLLIRLSFPEFEKYHLFLEKIMGLLWINYGTDLDEDELKSAHKRFKELINFFDSSFKSGIEPGLLDISKMKNYPCFKNINGDEFIL